MNDNTVPPAANENAPSRVSDLLAAMLAAGLPPTVTLGWLAQRLHERSFGAYILMLGILGMLPFASIPIGILIIVLAAQLVWGMDNPVLPAFIARKPIPTQRIVGPMRRVIAGVRKLETIIHPRWHVICRAPHLIGAIILLLALLLLIPIPFTNIVPSFVIAVIALAYIEKDGLLVALGLVAGIMTAVVIPALFLRWI